MKKIIVLILLTFTFLQISCSNSCENENPSVVLINNGTDKADIQIKTSGGNTENINNIEPGSSSAKRTFAPGNIEFTIAIQGVNNNITYTLTTAYCNEYTVTINKDNKVSSIGNHLEKTIL